MEIRERHRVMVGTPERYNVFLVGCGGTGSFLALHLARMAYHARERYHRDVRLTFIDPDVVEGKNIGRQNFAPAEVGQGKAHVLAFRYGVAFGLRIEFAARRFESKMLNVLPGWTLVVGAVDNVAARRELARGARFHGGRDLWWLDCGNHEHAGQVLLGNQDVEGPVIDELGVCTGLPLPSVQHPELVEAGELRMEDGGSPESCADLALRDVQGLMVNQAVATFAAQYVYRLVITGDLDVYATYFDLRVGSARSLGIVE